MSWVSSAFDGNDDFDLEEDSVKRSYSRGGVKMKQKKTSGAVEHCVLWVGTTKMVVSSCSF